MSFSNYHPCNSKLRNCLGIIVDFLKNDLMTFRTKHLQYNIDNNFDNITYILKPETHYVDINDLKDYKLITTIKNLNNSIVSIYRLYQNLILQDYNWINLPIFKTIWPFNLTNYHYFQKKKNINIVFNSHITFPNELTINQILDRIIKYQDWRENPRALAYKNDYIRKFFKCKQVDFNETFNKNFVICPQCNCQWKFKTKSYQLTNVKITKNNHNSQYNLNCNIRCLACSPFNNYENIKSIYKINEQCRTLFNYLLINYHNNKKYIISKRLYWYVISNIETKKINYIIMLSQLKKKLDKKLNITTSIIYNFLEG